MAVTDLPPARSFQNGRGNHLGKPNYGLRKR